MEAIKTLQLDDHYKALITGLKRRHAAPSHGYRTIDEDTVVIAPDGKNIAVFLKQVIPAKLRNRAYKSWKIVNELPDN
jgi:hypothetical protein